jgi:hypothetical protein
MALKEKGVCNNNLIPESRRMAKRNFSNGQRQPRHGKKSSASQHDKRTRLGNRNCRRRPTTEARCPLMGAMAELAKNMQAMLDARSAFRPIRFGA